MQTTLIITTMKKALIILVLVVTAIACHTQKEVVNGNKNYIPYTKFHNDTTLYLKTNFETNKSFYIGKPLKVLLNDFEVIPIGSYPTPSQKSGELGNNIGVGLFYFTEEQYEYRKKNRTGSLPLFMFIDFQEAVPSEKVRELMREDNKERRRTPAELRKYNPNSIEYQYYGEQIIKDIRVTPLIE